MLFNELFIEHLAMETTTFKGAISKLRKDKKGEAYKLNLKKEREIQIDR